MKRWLWRTLITILEWKAKQLRRTNKLEGLHYVFALLGFRASASRDLPLVGNTALTYFSIAAHSNSAICAIVYFDCTSSSISVRDPEEDNEMVADEHFFGWPGSSSSSISAEGNLDIAACFSGSALLTPFEDAVGSEWCLFAIVPSVPYNYLPLIQHSKYFRVTSITSINFLSAPCFPLNASKPSKPGMSSSNPFWRPSAPNSPVLTISLFCLFVKPVHSTPALHSFFRSSVSRFGVVRPRLHCRLRISMTETSAWKMISLWWIVYTLTANQGNFATIDKIDSYGLCRHFLLNGL